MSRLVKIQALGIQYLLRTSVNVSQTPLCKTRSCASWTIKVGNGSALRSKTGCFTVYGASELESLPPQCQIPFSSLNRLNCFCWSLKSLLVSAYWALFIHKTSTLVICFKVMVSWGLGWWFHRALNLSTALSTWAVSLRSFVKLLNRSHSISLLIGLSRAVIPMIGRDFIPNHIQLILNKGFPFLSHAMISNRAQPESQCSIEHLSHSRAKTVEGWNNQLGQTIALSEGLSEVEGEQLFSSQRQT